MVTELMKKIVVLILATSFLGACGGSSKKAESVIVLPPIPPVVLLDHSGLTPLSEDIILIEEYLTGGDATVFVTNKDAFGTRPQMIKSNFKQDGFFTAGDHLFRTKHTDIGPLLNNSACQNCHISDGRGELPLSKTEPMLTMLFKLADETGAKDPIYGDQLQPFAVQSFDGGDINLGLAVYDGSLNGNELVGEATPYIEYVTLSGQYPDGSSYQLRSPVYRIKDLSFGEFIEGIRFSPRLAPGIHGVGLLEAIPAENILALVDVSDHDNDGISGRPSMVTDVITGEMALGRFTYKAQNPSVLQQAASAYQGDMGLTTSIFVNEPCSEQQLSCHFIAEQEIKTADKTDVSNKELALVEFYNRLLGVPARRGYDPKSEEWESNIVEGRKLFFTSNCVGCHTPRHITGLAAGSVLGQLTLLSLEPNAEPIEVLSEQTIFPYTDLLLHDMGGSCAVTRELINGQSCTSGAECEYVQRCEGLADDLIQGDASGTEWKTPPLWGIGLVQTVNPEATFLHDGRARTIEEAILWHDGEALNSKNAFMQLSQIERQQLLQFVESL
jgi:CxxC motif-containing protein (DUF1111 family)